MTPQRFMRQLRKYVRAGRNEDAMAFAQRFGPDVTPHMTLDQLDLLWGTMEGVDMTLDLERWEREQQAASAADGTARAS